MLDNEPKSAVAAKPLDFTARYAIRYLTIDIFFYIDGLFCLLPYSAKHVIIINTR